MTKSESILGFSVNNITLDDIILDVPQYFVSKQKMLLTSINPQILLMALKDCQVADYLDQSTHCFPDGIGIVKVSRWTKGKINKRVAGIDVMTALIKYAEKEKKSVFLYGGSPTVVNKAVANLKKDYPKLKVAGYMDGYTTIPDYELVEQINKNQTDILFVALGSPKQEKWLLNNYPSLNSTIFQNVGGSFDVISGEVQRAPQWAIDSNLEWLYRSLSNPKRFYRILQLPVFVVKALCWKYKHRNEQRRMS